MRLITSKKEASKAVEVFVEAYSHAPNINWMFKQSPENVRYFFGMLVEEAMDREGAYLTSDNCGVLLLYDMKSKSFSLKVLLKKLYIIIFITGLKRSFQIIRLNHTKSKYRPKSGLYASVLAIKNHKSHWKTIFELKREFSNIAKNLNQPIYLETTNLRYFSLYEKLGFSKFYEMKHPYTDLNIYFLKM